MSRHVEADKLKPSPLSRRLVRRLREAGLHLSVSDNDYALSGLAPGYWQKASGAWAWSLYERRGKGWIPINIGSSDPASSLRRDSTVSYYKQIRGNDIEVCIDNKKLNK